MYEGVRAKIPYAYEKLLMDEYREGALVVTEYEGHAWREEERLWVRKEAKKEKEEEKGKRAVEPESNPRKRTWMQEMWRHGVS
jgi:hypothetical protein